MTNARLVHPKILRRHHTDATATTHRGLRRFEPFGVVAGWLEAGCGNFLQLGLIWVTLDWDQELEEEARVSTAAASTPPPRHWVEPESTKKPDTDI